MSLLPSWARKTDKFQERSQPVVAKMEDGLVVMEAENGTLDYTHSAANKHWHLSTKVPGASGKGVLIWKGPNEYSPSSAGEERTAPLTYYFEIDEPGTYHLTLRTIRPETGEEGDKNNDFYVEMPGEEWAKLYFHGDREEFQFGKRLDLHSGHIDATFSVTQDDIDANDGVFELGLTGRSHMAGIDQIHIQKDGPSETHGLSRSSIEHYADAAPKLIGSYFKGTDANDKHTGTASNETMIGGDGKDVFNGGGGADVLDGGDGRDRLMGDLGADRLSGGRDNDRLDGGAGNDVLEGGRGRDKLNGDWGADMLSGGRDDDQLEGGEGGDTLKGKNGDDILRGDGGADNLSGGAGKDRLEGGTHSDRLYGGGDRDVLMGGGGRDTFVLRKGTGSDRIVDFNVNQDTLLIEGVGAGFDIEERSYVKKGSLYIELGRDEIKLTGVTDASEVDFLIG
ncbi:MAG: calcium-binding protein [Pseudomonadota bacterium]